MTTSPVLASGVYSLFTVAWEAATDLGAFLHGEVPELAPEAREILRALGAGLTDEAAARRLGTSLRTYRRRVAELMAAGADQAPIIYGCLPSPSFDDLGPGPPR